MSGGMFEYIHSEDVRNFDRWVLESLTKAARDEGLHNIADKTEQVIAKLAEIEKLYEELEDFVGEEETNLYCLRGAWKAFDYGSCGDWMMDEAEQANKNLEERRS